MANSFGHAINTATCIVDYPEFGWLLLGEMFDGN
jgi:hypothetical protein